MSLAPGNRLGSYEILSLIGSGGMGEVYRARDLKLKREVAIKILPDAFANDGERLARFQREAELLATLNHPNIAQIHGIEEHALVLELVDGPTLADRIAQGPIPLEEAQPIAKQIANALEAAHERGIIHRDLKPANIKLTADGKVKVLDFGLAKALDRSDVGRNVSSDVLSQSPTITSPAMATHAGVILGTAAYMSPEQAKGRPVDRRTDIWAFGCVLYEMLSGRRAFPGDDVTDVLAGIIKDEPDWARVPPTCRRMLTACLRKDMRARLRDIGDAWELLDESASAAPAATPNQGRIWWILAATTTAALLLAATFAAGIFYDDAKPVSDPIRFQVAPPERSIILSLAVSPDGKRIAVVARRPDGEVKLWTRRLDALDFRLHTVNVRAQSGSVFWSPDSRFLVVWDRGVMKKVDVTDDTVDTLVSTSVNIVGELGRHRGGAWNRDGDIIYESRGLIERIAASGGDPVPVTTSPDSVGEFHAYPSLLPDGKRFLYLRESANAANVGVFVGDIRLSPDEQSTTRLLAITSPPVYVPGGTSQFGHLLFVRNGSLMTQGFDAERLELIGEATPLADDMTQVGSPLYSASVSGVIAFRRGAALSEEKRLLIHDRSGKVIGQIGPAADYRNVMLSPDGRFVAVDIGTPQQSAHVWAGMAARGVLSRLTSGDTPDVTSAVSSTGQVAFSYALDSALGDIYVAWINRADPPEPWVKSSEQKHPNHFSHDGRYLIYDSHHATRRQDLWIVRTAGDRTPIPFLATSADETFGQFSPDGRWVAYSSDESGKREVYVQGFAPERQPAVGAGKWAVSTAGGDKPRWSADGRELFYLGPDGQLMAVPVKLSPTFEPGLPTALFATSATTFFPYDVTPDGRFLINTMGGNTAQSLPPIDVVLNWRPTIVTKD